MVAVVLMAVEMGGGGGGGAGCGGDWWWSSFSSYICIHAFVCTYIIYKYLNAFCHIPSCSCCRYC